MDRAFERIAAAQLNALEAAEPAQARPQNAEEKMRQEAAPMTSKDAVQRILLSWKDKDYFRLLQLPPPEADELGRAVWTVTPAQVAKSYRSLSVLVHPDKNPGDDARQAFEVLNQAYRLLRDPGKLEEVLKDAASKARSERERRESQACMSERLALNAHRNVRAKELRKEEGQSFQAEIVQQMKRRQEEAKRKRAAQPTYRRQEEEEEQQPAQQPTCRRQEEEQQGRQEQQPTHRRQEEQEEQQQEGQRGQQAHGPLDRRRDKAEGAAGKGQSQGKGISKRQSSDSSGDEVHEALQRRGGGKKRKKPTFI